ncbi:MAG: hypothetical protein MUO50_05300 [Longimicrobiales bacterium]|nr:hypothetical protein [Longimicrobiales bacterium]
MRRLTIAVATVAALVALPSHAWGQIQAGPFLAFHDEADLGLGVFVGIPLPDFHENLSFVGDFGVFFPGDRGNDGVDADYWEANADLIYRFPIQEYTFTPWAMGGLNIAHGSGLGHFGGASGSDTDIGLNVGGGITFGSEPFQPFVGAKFELGGGEGAVIFGGLTFTIGSAGQ